MKPTETWLPKKYREEKLGLKDWVGAIAFFLGLMLYITLSLSL